VIGNELKRSMLVLIAGIALGSFVTFLVTKGENDVWRIKYGQAEFVVGNLQVLVGNLAKEVQTKRQEPQDITCYPEDPTCSVGEIDSLTSLDSPDVFYTNDYIDYVYECTAMVGRNKCTKVVLGAGFTGEVSHD